MDWNGTFRPFVSRPEPSLNFLCNYNFDQYPGFGEVGTGGLVQDLNKNNNNSNEDKKKRLTSDQLDSLERSFQEEIKLDPDRKVKLSRELGLQPRQIAVWFQNRRARWKAKQLERLYDTLKQEYDVVFREKQKLQDQVMKLKSMLREQAVYTEISGEETVESTSIPSLNKPRIAGNQQSNYLFNVDEYNPVSSQCWSVQLQLPSYP